MNTVSSSSRVEHASEVSRGDKTAEVARGDETAEMSRGGKTAEVSPGDTAGQTERTRELEALRAELDRVDDGLHDQLMRRAEVVAQVGALGAKGRVPLRPGREASILRRLVGRNAGALAPATLVRVWREMLAGSSAQQNAMRVVVGEAGLMPAVCEHFGALTTAEVVSPPAAIAQLRDGVATLAVLPLPSAEVGWWTELLDRSRWPQLHVVARLPFWARQGMIEALVLSTAEPDPSGQDRSLVAGSPAALGTFTVLEMLAVEGSTGLAVVDGLVAAQEASVVLGAYATQMGADR